MKLKYNILWLDDQIDDFRKDGWVDDVETHLIGEGFEPIIITLSDPEEISTHLSDELDLILTDYNLVDAGPLKNGKQVIEAIRKLHNSTEILFYTAKVDGLIDTEKLNRITFLETHPLGDHHKIVTREAKKLIDLTIKKFQHIIAMRGMIMHETSYLDEIKKDIINSCFECAGLDSIAISNEIFHSINDFLSEKTDKFSQCHKTQRIDRLMKDAALFSSACQIVAIKEILLQLKTTDFSEDYSMEINTTRNKFAHAVLKKNDHGVEYFEHGDGDIIFDAKKCKEIRLNIRKHKENLEKLKDDLDQLKITP
jgi:hypothetical protein